MSAEPLWAVRHRDAVARGERSYIDPETGYMVFTELQHLDRGNCCGSACRHCPFGHENVPPDRKTKLPLR